MDRITAVNNAIDALDALVVQYGALRDAFADDGATEVIDASETLVRDARAELSEASRDDRLPVA